MTEDTAVIVGASSGIGEALARELAERGHPLGLTARREERLQEIADEVPTEASVARMDVTETDDARETFEELVGDLGGADIVVLNAGVAPGNPDLEWDIERQTIDVNVRGFTALATAAIHHFEEQGSGHLVGMSSVGALVGNSLVPGYHASKAYVSNYLDGLRYRTDYNEGDVTVTTIEPGYVDTELATGDLWLVPVDTAADQIADAIEAKRKHAYISKRWRLIAWLLKAAPDVLKKRLA